MDLATGRWVPAGRVGPEQTEFDVGGLSVRFTAFLRKKVLSI